MNWRYITTFCFVLVSLVGGTIYATFRVDPFGIYRNVTPHTLSRIDQFWHMRLVKPLQLERKRPENLILGSSRAARISPEAAGFADSFNASIPGATSYEMRHLLSYAQSLRSLNSVILGLDFSAFISGEPQYRLGFNSKLLRADGEINYWLHLALAHKQALFSFQAIMQSISAYSAKGTVQRAAYLPDGSWYTRSARYPGINRYHAISRSAIDEFAERRAQPLNFDDIVAIIEICHDNNIQCHLVITPVHLVHFEIYRHAGLLDKWRLWHRELVQLNEDIAKRFRRPAFPLWAFNTAVPAVTESINTPKELDELWFKDNFHFRPQLGQVMLLDLMGKREKRPDNVGLRLKGSNVEDYLNEVLRLQKQYVNQDSDAVEPLLKRLGISPDTVRQPNKI